MNDPKPVRLSQIAKIVDTMTRSGFTQEKSFKKKVYTEEQQAKLDFFEPAARVLCKNRGEDPDTSMDVMDESITVSGLPEIYNQPRWQMYVDPICEAYMALGEATLNYQKLQEVTPEGADESVSPAAASEETH